MPIKNQQGKSTATWIPLVMALMLAIGFLTGMKTAKESGDSLFSVSKNKSSSTFKVDEVLGYISQRYVDSVDIDRLAEAAIRMIVDSLDPHSHYLDAETVAKYQERMDGEYVGIGIEFRILRDTIVVTDVLENSPAQKAGMARGDQIISVGTDTISGKDLPAHNVYSLLKGEKNSVANLQVRRCRNDHLQVDVTRQTVSTKSVPMAHAIDDSTVFIAIESFNSNTSKEFLDLLEPYHEKGQLQNLIIDLRGNPGGYLQEAVRILNQFFDKKGELLVYTEGMKSKKAEYKTAGRPYLRIKDVFVLIDENSASASEIVAGAIQDLDRGTIIGRRSFGKGLVQEQYALGHGGHLKLTIAKYYTPSGRLIQKQLGSREDYEDEFLDRATSGEWLVEGDIPLPDTMEYLTPSGRKLYGSRGIVPDIFIPVDSAMLKEQALEFYVLKEELAFDLFQYATCEDFSLQNIIEKVKKPGWKEFLKNKTSMSNIGRLNSLPETQEESFVVHLVELLYRYQDGKIAMQVETLKNDPFVHAAVSEMKSRSVVSELTTSK